MNRYEKLDLITGIFYIVVWIVIVYLHAGGPR